MMNLHQSYESSRASTNKSLTANMSFYSSFVNVAPTPQGIAFFLIVGGLAILPKLGRK